MPDLSGTVALSWGAYGGFYLHRRRVCLGWVALTVVPGVEIDDLMEAYVREREPGAEDVHYRIVRRGRPLARRYESAEEAFGVLGRMGGDGEIRAYNAAGKVVADMLERSR